MILIEWVSNKGGYDRLVYERVERVDREGWL